MKRYAWLFAALLFSSQGWAETLRVFCSGGMFPVMQSLKSDYQKQTGNQLVLEASPSMGKTPQAIPNRLARHDNADVLVMVDYAIKPLEEKHWVRADSHHVLAHSWIAMAVKQGEAPPDISTVDKFRKVVTQADSIAVSDSASGRYIKAEMFKKLGLGEETAKKAFTVPATPVGEVVAQGKASIGFQQNSELKAVKGITLVGMIPQAVQQDTLYGAVVTQSSQHRKAADELVKFLASAKAKAVMTEKGLTPL